MSVIDHIEIKNKSLKMTLILGDLFENTKDISLAHCVGKDYFLSAGIAVLFKKKFGQISKMKESNAKVGEAAIITNNNRFIYNLVTKEKSYEKPTYNSLNSSLEFMREHARKHKVKEIAMPLIGCGLDNLEWNTVRSLIKGVFFDEDIHIFIYFLNGDGNYPKLK